MVKDLFLELESIDIELSRLTLKNLNTNEREYRKYLVSKVERVSKEIMILAEKEGLTAHKNSVKVRINNG